MASAVLARASVETDPRVRFQLIATLGLLPAAGAAAAQSRLLFDHLDDLWIVRAALSAGSDRAPAYLDRALDSAPGAIATDSPSRRSFFHDLGVLVGARGQDQELPVRSAARARGGAPRCSRVSDRVSRDIRPLRSPGRAARWSPSRMPMTPRSGERRSALLARRGLPGGAESEAALDLASRTAVDPAADADRRADAIRLLAIDGAALRRAMLERLVRPREPEAVQIAALNALEGLRGDTVAASCCRVARAHPRRPVRPRGPAPRRTRPPAAAGRRDEPAEPCSPGPSASGRSATC